MLITKIQKSTIGNITREFFRTETPYNYILAKVEQLENHSPELMEAINTLANELYVVHDDADEDSKRVNKLRAIALCLVVVNCINTQMEIDWLKG